MVIDGMKSEMDEQLFDQMAKNFINQKTKTSDGNLMELITRNP